MQLRPCSAKSEMLAFVLALYMMLTWFAMFIAYQSESKDFALSWSVFNFWTCTMSFGFMLQMCLVYKDSLLALSRSSTSARWVLSSDRGSKLHAAFLSHYKSEAQSDARCVAI